ncbi:MAG TPA: hypothetical protein ENH91_15520 [Leeuwenhoekiella sp.]|nr:hypothetical protein [Leeuwenhoekiella sp.]
MIKKVLGVLLLIIILLPIAMWVAWLLTPEKKLVIAIIDKTVLTTQGQEHISLNWILNNNRFTKTSDKPYKINRDYFGFFPLKNENYELKGLERFSSNQLSQLSLDADLVYYTDTYGVYNNEWFKNGNISERSGMLYGGLSNQDIELLVEMKRRHKLILTEFNTIGSPTQVQNRKEFEKLFGLTWTGWTARYFNNLDLHVNQEIPSWLVRNYKSAHDGQWPFTRAGVAFVNKDKVVILEEGRHLEHALPYIFVTPKAQERFGLPDTMKYSFWFDVMIPNLDVNQVEASFGLNLTGSGKKELAKNKIPQTFPAVMSHVGDDYRFYYFSGDFSDNPIGINSSYFKGIGFFKGIFYDDRDPSERSSFFWGFYRPLLNKILQEEMELLHKD